MSKILIVYSTTDGQTKKICKRIKTLIETLENQVSVVSMSNMQDIDINLFQKVIIGASIRYGKHSKETYEFISNNRKILESKSNAFFSVNVVARKPDKNTPETNPYINKFLKEIEWKPNKLAVFAGKIEYQKYTFFDRFMIKLIMRMTDGPTDPKTNIEFTNWALVDKFSIEINSMK